LSCEINNVILLLSCKRQYGFDNNGVFKRIPPLLKRENIVNERITGYGTEKLQLTAYGKMAEEEFGLPCREMFILHGASGKTDSADS